MVNSKTYTTIASESEDIKKNEIQENIKILYYDFFKT